MAGSRSPLKEGNVYYLGPAKSRRFLVSKVYFSALNPGVAVKWLTVDGSTAEGRFYLCANEAEFWAIPKFRNSTDAEDGK